MCWMQAGFIAGESLDGSQLLAKAYCIHEGGASLCQSPSQQRDGESAAILSISVIGQHARME